MMSSAKRNLSVVRMMQCVCQSSKKHFYVVTHSTLIVKETEV